MPHTILIAGRILSHSVNSVCKSHVNRNKSVPCGLISKYIQLRRRTDSVFDLATSYRGGRIGSIILWTLGFSKQSAICRLCSALHVHMKLIILEIACFSSLPHMYRHMVIDLCSSGMMVAFHELPSKVSHSYIWALYPCLCFVFE